MLGKRFRQVYVEVTNVCNLSCSFCRSGGRVGRTMGVEFFAGLVEQLAPLTEQVYLHVLGEPLLHPQFAELLAVCAAAALPVAVTTNGTLLDTPAGAALLSPVVRQVNVSLHGLAGLADAEWQADRLRQALDWVEAARGCRPDLYVNCRLWNLPGASVREAGGAWNERVRGELERRLGVSIPLGAAWGWRKGRRLVGRIYLHFDRCFVWPEMTAPEIGERGFCHGLGTHFGILADGTVVPCCLDGDGVMALGKAGEQSVAEILASPRAVALAAGFQAGRVVEPLCRRCAFRTRFRAARRGGGGKGFFG